VALSNTKVFETAERALGAADRPGIKDSVAAIKTEVEA